MSSDRPPLACRLFGHAWHNDRRSALYSAVIVHNEPCLRPGCDAVRRPLLDVDAPPPSAPVPAPPPVTPAPLPARLLEQALRDVGMLEAHHELSRIPGRVVKRVLALHGPVLVGGRLRCYGCDPGDTAWPCTTVQHLASLHRIVVP